MALLYQANHLAILGERENEESESEKGDKREFKPLARRRCSTRSERHASSFIL